MIFFGLDWEGSTQKQHPKTRCNFGLGLLQSLLCKDFLFSLFVVSFLFLFLQSVELPSREEFPAFQVIFQSIKKRFAVIQFHIAKKKIEFYIQFMFLIQLSNPKPFDIFLFLVLSFSVRNPKPSLIQLLPHRG